MERDSNDMLYGSSNGPEATGGSVSGGMGSSGTTGSESSGSTTDSMMDRAKDIAGNAQDKLADVGSSVRDKAGSAKNSLADVLESGADRLRQRAGSGQMAGATGAGSVAMDGDNRVAQLSNRLASGMDATADWIRDADLDSMRSAIEGQVREHPGRTLLIAAGLGYLIGKAFRNNS